VKKETKKLKKKVRRLSKESAAFIADHGRLLWDFCLLSMAELSEIRNHPYPCANAGRCCGCAKCDRREDTIGDLRHMADWLEEQGNPAPKWDGKTGRALPERE
jgi:hypothetical protein